MSSDTSSSPPPSASAASSSSSSSSSTSVSSASSARIVSSSGTAAGQTALYFLHTSFVSNFIAGGLAGAVSRTVVSPLERMKILFQIQQAGSAAYRGVWPTLVKMWREEGWRGYMRGNGSNCLRIFPYSAIQFASYNLYKPAFLRPGQQELDVTSRLTAGALAGITSVALTYPLDITRTRLSIQCADLAWHANHSHSHSHSPGPSPSQAQAQGMWGTMKEIYTCEGGTRALYRGMMPTIYGVAPYVGLNFAVYESVRRWFVSRHGPTSPSREPAAWEKLASGAISGAIAQSLTYPFDVLRRRFQVNNMPGMPHRYNTVWDAIKAISAKEGIRGFYQGLWPNLLKVVPSMSSSWLTFEVARSYLLEL